MLTRFFCFVISFLTFLNSGLSAQTAVPYYNSFDQIGDTSGWTHYAISGIDDWQIGKPNKSNFKSSYSSPNAWVTNLTASANLSSNRALETPVFDLSDTSGKMVLSFVQMRRYSSAYGFWVEYSVNSGNSWNLLLDANAMKKNWQNSGGFSGNTNGFVHSAISVRFLQGNDSVKFRFRYSTATSSSDGWLIDNFSLANEYYNFFASKADDIYISQKCQDVKLKTTIGFNNQFTSSYLNTSNFYLSEDSVLDITDSLIGIRPIKISDSYQWTINLNIPWKLNAGKYFIIYVHDALDTLSENNENDNTGFARLMIDSVYNLPYHENFEDETREQWRPYVNDINTMLVWEKGSGSRHHIEGAHSGIKAWHTGKSAGLNVKNCGPQCYLQYVQSPYFDFTSDTANDYIINFWYKMYEKANAIKVEYSVDCGNSWMPFKTLNSGRNDDWDYVNIQTSGFAGQPSVAFRIAFTTSYLDPEGIVFDDFYIGPKLSDLSVEKDKTDRFTSSQLSGDTLRYYFQNSGLHSTPTVSPATTTRFYWSSDSVLDVSDVFLGTNTEPVIMDTSGRWNTFTYTKPTLNPGKYFIFYVLNTTNSFDETRYDNNVGHFRIFQSTPYVIPYSNDFESQSIGWRHQASLGKDQWVWSNPSGNWKEKPFSSTKAWLSSDSGNLSRLSRTHLYTPVFDLRNNASPVMEFDMINLGDGSCNCHNAKMNMSYSTDGGATWLILDTANASFNRWYYPMEYNAGVDRNYYLPNYSEILFKLSEPAFAMVNQYNSRDAKRNTRYILDISQLKGKANVQFRYNIGFGNDLLPDSVTRGALIDNFTIRNGFTDLLVDYKKPLMVSSKAGKIKFFMHVKNNGNYFSKKGIVKFYLSDNTVLDSNDFVLGQTTLNVVRPDMYSYLNVAYTAPLNLSSYKYLLYYLDAGNTTIESDESNNVSYWNLAVDSFVSLPYLNDFSDTIQSGWHQYSLDPGTNAIGTYRFRNLLVPSEYLYQTAIHSKEFFTDRMLSGSWNTPPRMFLETPPFNFANDDSIRMSFDLMCTGTGADGGTLRYSEDGGNTWKPLTDQYKTAYKWFNRTGMSALNGSPGWARPASQNGLNPGDSTSIDISFLKGLSDIRFQFEYKSNYEALGSGTPQGMRLDNFIVEGSDIDLVSNDSLMLKNLAAGTLSVTIPYQIECKGTAAGRHSNTYFYWSEDNQLDSGDLLLKVKNEDWIKSGSTVSTSAIIDIPDLDTQTVYYIFYRLDGDNKLNEKSEDNNLGKWRLQFQESANYLSLDTSISTLVIDMNQTSFVVNYKIRNNGKINGIKSETQFFWSLDSLLDVTDVMINNLEQDTIKSGELYSDSLRITYPKPLTQTVYFVIYKADYRDSIIESNENDNIGIFRIKFKDNSSIEREYAQGLEFYTYGSALFVVMNEAVSTEGYTVKVYNRLAQVVYSSDNEYREGITKIDLSQYISSGYYFVQIETEGKTYTGVFYLSTD